MGRKKVYANSNERVRAFRERKKLEKQDNISLQKTVTKYIPKKIIKTSRKKEKALLAMAKLYRNRATKKTDLDIIMEYLL